MAAFYDDLIFPPSISLSAFKGSRLRSTTVVQTQSGFTQRRSLWAQTRRTFDAGLVTRPIEAWRLIDDFFEICEGQAIGFLLQDPTDYQVDQASGLLAPVTGSTFSFQKVRQVASHFAYRAIAKPDVGQAGGSSSITIWRIRDGVTTLVPSSNYAIDAINGSVLFVEGYVRFAAPGVAGDAFRWSGKFFLPVRFSTDSLDWTVVDKQVGEGNLLVQGPSVPITEEPWPGTLYIPPT